MADNDNTLTTADFSKQTGMAVSTITKMLRQGKITGEKRGGKWAIYASELQNPIITRGKHTEASISPVPASSASSDTPTTYNVETFARMTYLTEYGVRQWLRIGRLKGATVEGGEMLVDAVNLKRPELQHLLRK
jgi:excisionase family DNA binding protein